MENVPAFFAANGWDVWCAYADDYDQGRNVGRKGLIFVQGRKLEGPIPQVIKVL